MEDPDHGWKPSRRPQSTIALNFMSELDDLFKMDGDLNSLDKAVTEKRQTVHSATQELEALQARLRATEERLNGTAGSPPRRRDSQRRTPTKGTFFDDDKAQLQGPGSPEAKTPRVNGHSSKRPSAQTPPQAEEA